MSGERNLAAGTVIVLDVQYAFVGIKHGDLEFM